MIRVAIDATPTIGHKSGIGVFAANIIDGLALRDDLELTAFAVSWRGRKLLPSSLPTGVRCSLRPMPAGVLQAAWARFDGPVIERFTGPVDVVHGTDFVVPPARRAAEVVTVPDLTCVRFPEWCEPVSLRFPLLIRRALRRGAIVHTCSEIVAAEIVEHFRAPPELVKVVALGVSAAGASGRPGTRAPSPPSRPYILGIGNIEPRKDFPTLVRAFECLAGDHPDLELVIAGARGWGEDALRAVIDQSPYAGRIRQLGWVTDEQRAKLLAGASVLAYPSLYEGFGLPPLEAMSAGVPVVASTAGSLPEVLGDAALLVPPGDRDALASGLSDVLERPEERRRLTEAGTARAAGYTWERCVAGLASLYADAVAARR
ncbi:MAG: glycosyltransferase family 1 protein [Acidimicrobiales bacterium]|jgi:glycosyltransferase involved in cell wall biosynthesis